MIYIVVDLNGTVTHFLEFLLLYNNCNYTNTGKFSEAILSDKDKIGSIVTTEIWNCQKPWDPKCEDHDFFYFS